MISFDGHSHPAWAKGLCYDKRLSFPYSQSKIKRKSKAKKGELLLLPIFQFEGRAAVQALVATAMANNLDLADLLIAEAARLTGCQKVLTFDKKAASHEMFQLIEEP